MADVDGIITIVATATAAAIDPAAVASTITASTRVTAASSNPFAAVAAVTTATAQATAGRAGDVIGPIVATANVGAYIGSTAERGLMRPHLYLPLVDETGELLPFALVQIYREDGTTLYPGTLWRDGTSTATWLNPHNSAPAVVDLYLDAPARVVIGYTADQTQPEKLTEVIDVVPDPATMVLSPTQMLVDDPVAALGMFGALDSDNAVWVPVTIAHQHNAIALGTVRTGDIGLQQAQVGSFTGTTALGAQAGAPSEPGSIIGATMFGFHASAAAHQGVAVGAAASVLEDSSAPWTGQGVALGLDAVAGPLSVAVGVLASSDTNPDQIVTLFTGINPQIVDILFDNPDTPQFSSENGWTRALVQAHQITQTLAGSVALGALATAEGSGFSAGPGARAGQRGVALGGATGALSHGSPGSIGLGWGAQYGLPSDTDGEFFAVLLGAHDPTVNPSFLWSNPHHSQSESWLTEFLPDMQFVGNTVQIQRHLQWLIDAVALQVQGDCTIGGIGGTVGFFGHTPVAQVTVSDDEPGSGLPALDSLIFALRDLGLLAARNEAMMIYRSADLAAIYLDDDQVTLWPEHRGRDLARVVRDSVIYDEDDGYNGFPALEFHNDKWSKWSSHLQQLRATQRLAPARHFIVVANHDDDSFGVREGLFNLAMPDGKPDPKALVLAADPDVKRTWQKSYTYYEVDGLDQSINKRIKKLDPDDRHVYQVTNDRLWPRAVPIIGGPPDGTSRADSWSGTIAEVIGMDSTWDKQHAHWMATGLDFLYSIHENDYDYYIAVPAQNFLRMQHDPVLEAKIFWDHDDDCDDWSGGRVYGYVENAPDSVVTVPYVKIHDDFDVFVYTGPCSGYWSDIDDWDLCELVLISKDESFDSDTGVETIVGVYALNGNGTWSTGKDWCPRGYKRVVVREKISKKVKVINGTLPIAMDDLEVRIYSTKDDGDAHDEGDDGPLRLEATVPLQGDRRFSGRVRHHQRDLIARLYQKSTDTVMATTEKQSSCLPRTTIYAADDPDTSPATVDRAGTYESALAVMAFMGMEKKYWYRARRILKILMRAQNNDGSLNDSYSSDLPGSSFTAPVSLRGCVWTILAELRYEWFRGDDDYRDLATGLGNYLLTRQQSSGSLLDPSTGLMSTADNAVAYFALRDLGRVTGTSSYTTAANAIKASLLANHWTTNPIPRWKRSATDDAEELVADVFGGLFLVAIGRWDRAHDTVRHLRRLRVTGATIATGHYTNTAKVLGYKPYGELGVNAYINPPAVIDQAHTWAALLFKARYGEPIGQEVESLMKWHGSKIINDPHGVLDHPQWMAYNQTVEGAYHLRARPYVGAAAWAGLLANGSFDLLMSDRVPAPVPTNLTLTRFYDYDAKRVHFDFTWTQDPTVPAARFEAQPQYSTDGTIWTNLSSSKIAHQLPDYVDPTHLNGYKAYWTVKMPSNRSTTYRVQLRVRNTAYGSWVTSGVVNLPTIR